MWRDLVSRLKRLEETVGGADKLQEKIEARANVRAAVEDLKARIERGEPLPELEPGQRERPDWSPAHQELWDRLERMAEVHRQQEAEDDGGSPVISDHQKRQET